MIQSVPVKNCGSALERAAISGVGAYFAPGPEMGTGTIWIWRTPGVWLRISISATPGMTCGGRIVTARR
jgi:hypothetical protein